MSGDTRKEIQDRSRKLSSVSGAIINTQGYIVHPFVTIHPISTIGRKPMAGINAIVVHQTCTPDVQSALTGERIKKGIGAHFYIDKDGSIYQAASLDHSCSHVGFLKPRCLFEHRCKPDEAKRIQKLYNKPDSKKLNHEEMKKSFPDRYPSNEDSIGIELVGMAGPKDAPDEKQTYEVVTDRQNQTLKWLISIISKDRGVNANEIYRHPDVSRKNPTEASTAKW